MAHHAVKVKLVRMARAAKATVLVLKVNVVPMAHALKADRAPMAHHVAKVIVLAPKANVVRMAHAVKATVLVPKASVAPTPRRSLTSKRKISLRRPQATI